MSKEFKMPMVAESVVEGEVGKWFVSKGDEVKEDQPLLEVLTDKVNVEVPSPFDGYILKIVVPEGEVAKVGEVLAIYGQKEELSGESAEEEEEKEEEEPEKEEKPQEKEPGEEKPRPHPVPHKKPEPGTEPIAPEEEGKKKEGKAWEFKETPRYKSGEVKAVPAARKLASEKGVELSGIEGSGPRGVITVSDVQEATGENKPEMTEKEVVEGKVEAGEPREREERIKLRGVRRNVAVHMRKVWERIVPALHVDSADLTELVSLRAKLKKDAEEGGVHLTYLPFIAKAVTAGLKLYPEVNTSLDDEAEELVRHHYYNIGIAVDTDKGLVVPVVKDVDRKDILHLAREMAELAEKARQGRLELSDVRGSTFSITNIGSLGGLISYPVINHPDAAILGVHSIKKRPVVRSGEVVVRDMVYLSLAFDHRIFDGATASRFTSAVIERLEDPALLFWK